MSVPKNLIVPLYFVFSPSIDANNVDLPAPFGPIIPRKSPSFTVKLTSSRAFTPGYSTVRCSISTTFNTRPPLDYQDFHSF